MTRYAALDWVYVDTNIPKELVTREYIEELKANHLWPASGEKFDLSDDQYTLFNEITARHIPNIETYKRPGGSAFNTLSTVSEALDSPVTLVAYLGTKLNAQVIRGRIAELPNFKIEPEFTGTDVQDQILTPSANVVNYVDESGQTQKVNFKHPGRGRNYISQEHITKAISECDVFFLPGGVIDKYGIDLFMFTLEECKRQGKEICFTLPTTVSTTMVHQDMIRDIILKHASVILANKKEVLPICQLQNWDTSGLKAAGFISELLSQNPNNIHGDFASAFFTDEARPSYLVNHSALASRQPGAPKLMQVEQVELWPVKKELEVSTNGCGDAAYAGYLIGLALGLSHQECALLAMRFSAENIQVNEARTPNPKAILDELGLTPGTAPQPQGKLIQAFFTAREHPLAGLAHAA